VLREVLPTGRAEQETLRFDTIDCAYMLGIAPLVYLRRAAAVRAARLAGKQPVAGLDAGRLAIFFDCKSNHYASNFCRLAAAGLALAA
jgi:hypothetical protein